MIVEFHKRLHAHLLCVQVWQGNTQTKPLKSLDSKVGRYDDQLLFGFDLNISVTKTQEFLVFIFIKQVP